MWKIEQLNIQKKIAVKNKDSKLLNPEVLSLKPHTQKFSSIRIFFLNIFHILQLILKYRAFYKKFCGNFRKKYLKFKFTKYPITLH